MISTNKLKNSIFALLALFFSASAINTNAATITITTNTSWSNIKSGSGTNGLPNKTDDIVVRDGATLTVNQDGEVKSITLGNTSTSSPSIGHVAVSANKTLEINGSINYLTPSNSGGVNKGNYNTFYLNSGSTLYAMGISGTWYNPSTSNGITGPGTANTSWNGTPLPVDFISFTAIKNGDQAILNWATAWEINNAGFEVERSTNGVSWQKIGFVNGNGDVTSVSNYAFAASLVNTSSAVVYFRLKQVDFNGQFAYSATRALRLSGAAATTANVYPNPAANKISVNLEGMQAGELATVSVMDMSGKVLVTTAQNIEEGNYRLDLNIENLVKGNYIVNITSASASYNTKLVKF